MIIPGSLKDSLSQGLARVDGRSLDQEHVTGVSKNVVEPFFQL